MAAYVIAAISSVTDPPGFAEYVKLATPTVEKYGGKFIASGNKIEVADGIWSPVRMVVLEFQSLQRAKQWYNSPEYKPLVSRRKASSTSGVIFVDGG